MAERITRLEKKDIYNRWLIRQVVEAYGSANHIDLTLARIVIATYVTDPTIETKLTATMLNQTDTTIIRMVAYAIAKLYEARDNRTIYTILDNQLREQQ